MRSWPIVAVVLAATSAAFAQDPAVLPPPGPPIDDPMLAPVPPAPRAVAGWDDALGDVRARSTDLHIAYARVTQAEGGARVALAAMLPSISGSLTGSHQFLTKSARSIDPVSGNVTVTTTPTENALSAGASVSVSLVNARSLFGLETAHRSEQAARLSVEDEKRVLTLALATTMLSVLTAERVAQLARVGVRSALERQALTKVRERLGAATSLDLVRGQQDVAASRTTLVNADESLRQAREALGLALGVPIATGLGSGVDANAIEHGASSACVEIKSLEERPDLQLARVQAEIAARGVTDVWLQFLPTLSAPSNIGAGVNDAARGPAPTWSLSAVLSVPVWDGGARYGLLTSARASTDQSIQQLEALRRNTTVDGIQARRAVDVAQQSLDVSKQVRDLAAEVDRLTRTGYERGQGTSLDLVVAASALRQADVNLALQEFAVVRTRVTAALTFARCQW